MLILTTYIAPISFLVIIVIGLLGNGLVIIVILRNGHMRNSTNTLIGSLALADLTFIVGCIPLTICIYVTRGWFMGEFLCKTYQYFTRLTVLCSVYTLVMMSLDRYLAVVHPIKSVQWRTKYKTVAMVTALWIVLIVANLPLFLESGIVNNPLLKSANHTRRRHYCTYKRLVYFNHSLDGYVDDFKAMGYFHFTNFLFAFLIPLSVIVVLYGLLLYRISKRVRNRNSSNITRSNKKVTRMVIIVIIAFALSWLPIHIVFIIQTIIGDPDSVVFRSFHIIANCMVYSNSMVNPILYAFLSENFRTAFKSFLCADCEKCYTCYSRITEDNTVSASRGKRLKM